jgi:hypothetical protein
VEMPRDQYLAVLADALGSEARFDA